MFRVLLVTGCPVRFASLGPAGAAGSPQQRVGRLVLSNGQAWVQNTCLFGISIRVSVLIIRPTVEIWLRR
jgi:hypothetical protein